MQMRMTIDIHAHYVSPRLIEEARRNGGAYGVMVERLPDGSERLGFCEGDLWLRPFFAELCDLAIRLPYLDVAGVDLQVVSTWTDMAGDQLPARQGARWARLQNETLAADAHVLGHRFVAMGTLPMQDMPSALAELDHMVAHLGIRSVEIGTNISGRDLDHADFRPLWKRLADFEMFVLLHPPFRPVGLERAGDYFLNNLISYPVDTTLAAARLMFSGIMRDFPGLRCCLAHGGGFLPYQIGRLDRGFAAHPACKTMLRQPPSELLGSFYYDTLTHNTQALAFLSEMVPPQRLLYGSDYPFEMLDESGPARVRQVTALSRVEIDGILGTNARTLLRLAEGSGQPAPKGLARGASA
jgi:aminocarboxymuconate-semialdehyde decarboxylase